MTHETQRPFEEVYAELSLMRKKEKSLQYDYMTNLGGTQQTKEAARLAMAEQSGKILDFIQNSGWADRIQFEDKVAKIKKIEAQLEELKPKLGKGDVRDQMETKDLVEKYEEELRQLKGDDYYRYLPHENLVEKP